MKRDRVRIYTDASHDDFANTHIQTKAVGEDFPFARRSLWWQGLAFLLYYGVALPLVWLIAKLYLGLRFENRPTLRELRRLGGCFLYGNHTRNLDCFLPPLAAFPRRAYTVAGPDAVSVPLLKNLVLLLGGLPIPTEFAGMRRFLEAVSLRYRQKAWIAIYPEAHVWPFYTGIRPFPDTSFRYPVRENAPVVAMVTTYRKRRGLFRRCPPGMTVTFSPPLYPDPNLHPKEAQRKLRDQVLAFMEATAAEKENVAHIRYVPSDSEEHGEAR